MSRIILVRRHGRPRLHAHPADAPRPVWPCISVSAVLNGPLRESTWDLESGEIEAALMNQQESAVKSDAQSAARAEPLPGRE